MSSSCHNKELIVGLTRLRVQGQTAPSPVGNAQRRAVIRVDTLRDGQMGAWCRSVWDYRGGHAGDRVVQTRAEQPRIEMLKICYFRVTLGRMP